MSGSGASSGECLRVHDLKFGEYEAGEVSLNSIHRVVQLHDPVFATLFHNYYVYTSSSLLCTIL